QFAKRSVEGGPMGITPDRRLETLARFLEPPEAAQHQAQISVERCHVGLQCDGSLEAGPRLLRAIQMEERIAEVRVRLRVIRPQRERRAEMPDGLVIALQLAIHRAQEIVCL